MNSSSRVSPPARRSWTAACVLAVMFNPIVGLAAPNPRPTRLQPKSQEASEAPKAGQESMGALALAERPVEGVRFVDAQRDVQGVVVTGLDSRPDPVAPAELTGAELEAWKTRANEAEPELKTFFPTSYTEPFIVEGDGVRVVIRAVGGSASGARVEDGRLVYRGAYPQTDSIHRVQSGRSEEILLLHDESAPTQFDYEIVSVEGATQVFQHNGGIRFVDAKGRGLEIEPPWLADASGERHSDLVWWEIGRDQESTAQSLRLVVRSDGSPYPLAVDPSWSVTGSMVTPRAQHATVLFPDGRVLAVGAGPSTSSAAEIYDPVLGQWTSTAGLLESRRSCAAVLLPTGKALVVGGFRSSSEIFDPSAGSWSTLRTMAVTRTDHTATLLLTGEVLVVGGGSNQAEMYSPTTNMWRVLANPFPQNVDTHTATLLNDGTVLVAGGRVGSTIQSSCVRFNPSTETWTSLAPMLSPRYQHTATKLPDGRVLVSGGHNGSVQLSSSEIYNPTLNSWQNTPSSMSVTRIFHTATLLPTGRVLVTGGGFTGDDATNTTEIYDPVAQTWTSAGLMSIKRTFHTATMMPNGGVLISGGYVTGLSSTISCDIYDYSTRRWATGPGLMNLFRIEHAASLLPDGKVLVTGGYYQFSSNPIGQAELYNPQTMSWTAIGSLVYRRSGHTSTLLPNGKVLIAGGFGAFNSDAKISEEYDPVANTFVASLNGLTLVEHYNGRAVLLRSGKVLLAGGNTSLCEVYDPTTHLWTPTGPLSVARTNFTATLLPNGKILAVGGATGAGFSATAEVYDPETGTWMGTGGLTEARAQHDAVLLPSGNVLVMGGYNGTYLSRADLYSPASGGWTATTSMTKTRGWPRAEVLPGGKVLVNGGDGPSPASITSEIFDPVTAQWSAAGTSLQGHVHSFTATRLLDGSFVIAGGFILGQPVEGSKLTELYYPDDAVMPIRPIVSAVTNPIRIGEGVTVTGTGFRGVSESNSGKYGGAPTNFPLVRVQSLVNGQLTYLPLDQLTGSTDSSFACAAAPYVTPGPAIVDVISNGVSSVSTFVQVTLPSAPSGLTAAAVSPSRINLSWSDTTPNESGFKIERRAGAGAWSQVATVGANVLSYANIGLAAGTAYTYRVRSFNGVVDGAYSNEATATTLGCAVPVIVNQPQSQVIQSGNSATLGVAATGAEPLSLQWFQQTSPGNFSPIGGATESTFNTGVLNSTSVYRVRVTDACGSVDSAVATVTVELAVSNPADSGAGTLREAIALSNATPGIETIQFNFPGNGVHTITLTGQPLQITAPVIIDGRSQPGYTGVPLIELRGTYDGIAPPPDCLGTDGDDGLHFTSTAAGSEVRGLVINGFTGDGIEFEGGGDMTHRSLVIGCFIGTNAAGSAAIRNRRHGIFINAAAWSRIGGVRNPDGTLKDGCLISGNRCSGIEIRGGLAGHNEVIGSNIGTNLMATGGIGNNIGIHIDGAPDNTIGAAGDDASKKNQCGYNNGGGVVNSGTVNTNPNGSGPPNTVILGTVFTGNDGGAIIGGIGPTPQIASAGLSSTTLSIAGTLQFPPEEGGSKQYRIQYFGNTSCATGGQGEVLLAADVLKLSSPTGLLDLAFSSASTTVRPGELVALTVTGPGGTSNFSACVPVTGALQVTAQRSGTVGFSAILGPHGAAHDVPNTITPGLSRSFAGPGDPDNPDVSEDEVVPPDPQGAVGLSHVVAVTNVDITIQNKTSGAVIDSATLDGLWASLKLAPAEELSTFNPRAAYDPYGQRFIVAACANPRKANSSVLVAVSRTSDPTGEWNVYRYDAEGANLLWADYPTLGFTKDWIAVQVNMSSIAFSDTILRSEVYLVDKAAMYAGTPGTGKATVLGSASLGRTQVPAMTFDPALGTLYLLQTAEGNVGGFGKLNSFIISGPVGSESMAVGPVFQTPRTWFSPSQIPPDLAPQLGSPVKIAVNDTRMHSVIYRNGKLYAAHTVLLPAAGPTPTLSGVQWYELNPANGTVVQDGRVSDESGLVFYAYPALAVNAAGNMILGYSRFSATTFASAAYRFRESGDAAGTLSGEQMLKSGLAKYDKTLGFGANRWGDYSTAAVDPSDNATFWLLNEYAAMPRIGTATTDQWGTWWGSVDGSTQCTFACSANIAVGTGSGSLMCGKVVTYPAPTLTGTCGTVTCVPASGTSFPVGTTTVTCSDGAGHGCSFTVTVTDDTVPAITCPANQTATASGPQGVAFNYPAPTVTDNCPGASVNCSPASGSVFPVGVTVVNCTASDASSNTAGCSFTVTVTDGTAQTADLSVVGFQAIVPAGVSPLVVYQVTARNLGPSQASGATLVNTLPTGTTYAGSMASQGSISAPALGSPGTVTVNFGPIPAGGSATATVLITVVSPLLSITNTVSVSSSTSDPIPSNNTASLVTPVNFAPGAPSSLTATAISASQINLAWLDNSVNESNFFVDRKTGAGGTWGLVATLGPNTTSYASVGLSMATTYFYRVRAANANGESANSNEASATTLTSGPTELVTNGSFESGATSWTQTPGTIINNSGSGAAFDGTWKATILGSATVTTHTLYQTPAFPATGATKTLRFQMRIQTAESIGFPYDKLFVRITNSAGATLTTLATYSNANSGTYANYGLVTLTIPAQYAVSGNQLRFVATSNFQLATTFYIDAVSVQ